MENEINIDKLYNYMKGECNNSNHTGKAIYYCINKNCKDRYLCSECLIENIEHFTLHLKTLIPLDTKSKFMKFLDLTGVNVFSKNDNINYLDHIKNIYWNLKRKYFL